jgi:hypothetical protein
MYWACSAPLSNRYLVSILVHCKAVPIKTELLNKYRTKQPGSGLQICQILTRNDKQTADNNSTINNSSFITKK